MEDDWDEEMAVLTVFSFWMLYCSINYGLNILHGIQNENKSSKKSLKVQNSVFKLSLHLLIWSIHSISYHV